MKRPQVYAAVISVMASSIAVLLTVPDSVIRSPTCSNGCWNVESFSTGLPERMVYPLYEGRFCPLLQMTIAAVMGIQAVDRIELAEIHAPIGAVDCDFEAHFDTCTTIFRLSLTKHWRCLTGARNAQSRNRTLGCTSGAPLWAEMGAAQGKGSSP